jgi:hypothetical protein
VPAVDLAELRAELETEREWREAEMRLFRNQVAALEEEAARRIARKALVVMLYAHFEGGCRALLAIYVNRLNALGISVAEAVPALGAASLGEVFLALRDSNKKCKEFRRSLPDDTALHLFAREREFVEVAWEIAQRPVRLDVDRVVDTESNLKPVVLRKMLFRLGLDPKLAEPWEATIAQLLKRRNDVAHGTAKQGLEERDYDALEHAVNAVIEGLVMAISNVVRDELYLLARSAPPPATPPVDP